MKRKRQHLIDDEASEAMTDDPENEEQEADLYEEFPRNIDESESDSSFDLPRSSKKTKRI